MANVKFNRKEFEKAVGKIDEKLQHKIAMFGTPLESVSANELEIEIFPNRPDLLSLQGYLRSFLPFLGKKSKSYKLHKPQKDYEVKIKSSVNQVRPYTACAIVKNLKFDDEKIKEIIDIQEKLHTTIARNRKKVAIGIYPLEHIKLPITYQALPPAQIKFQPLEESRELTASQILTKTSAGRNYAYLLEGEKAFPIFIDANNETLSMPPIINSHKTGKITEKTKAVFIECSGFDLAILQKVLNILVTTLADMQGEVYQMRLKYKNKTITTPDLIQETIRINIKDCNKLLGLNLTEKQVKILLQKMGYEYKAGKVSIPAYRADILHPVDIYEDIAVAYGYDKFQPELPEISTIGNEDKKSQFNQKLSEILIGLGLLETSSHHLTTKENLKKTGIKTQALETENSKTEFNLLRPNLLANQLKILSENTASEYPQNIFELGKVFNEKAEEQTNLAITKTPGNFTELKQILQYLEEQLQIKLAIKETENPGFIPGRVGSISLKGREIGIIGEISPQVLKNWHLKMPVSCLEINLDELI